MATTVGALKELDEWKKKIDASAMKSVLWTLQMVIARPVALFDPYAAIAALDEVVNVTKERKHQRASRYEIVPSNSKQPVPSTGINKAGGI